MIYLSELIVRLRNQCPSFQRRVGGTATFAATTAAGVPSANLKVPHCFIIPGTEDNITGRDQYIGDETERRREHFDTVICLDNSVSVNGPEGKMDFATVDQIRVIQQEIEAAWRDWVPQQKFDRIDFVSGRHLALNNSRLWHVFTWSTDYTTSPGVSDENEERVNREIRAVTESEGNEHPGNVRTIYATYDPDRNIEDPATVQDFFLYVDPPPPPSPQALQNAVEGADAVIQVVPRPVNPEVA